MLQPTIETRTDGLFNVTMPSGTVWNGVDQARADWLRSVGAEETPEEHDARVAREAQARERRKAEEMFARIWDAAHEEHARREQRARDAAERERVKAEKRAARFVPGTDFRRYDGAPDCEWVLAWLEEHLVVIRAGVPIDQFDKFAANLRDANGQEFTPLMDGVMELSEKSWAPCIHIHVNADIPFEFYDVIEGLQTRIGKRAEENITDNPRVVFCNQLGWEILRRGYPLG